MNYAYGFVNKCIIISNNKRYVKASSTDFHYEYQYDWISGEVPWEFIETEKSDDFSIIYDKKILDTEYSPIKIEIQNMNIIDKNVVDTNVVDTNVVDIAIIKSEFVNNMISKAIMSGVMKGFYVQIMSIDNIITYTQCYTNKVIDMDILLSLLYFIIYEKIKNIEIENIIILKKYNNIELFEKYIKLRRNSMIVIIILYVLLFRGISNVE
jgi:hypothetical protein